MLATLSKLQVWQLCYGISEEQKGIGKKKQQKKSLNLYKIVN